MRRWRSCSTRRRRLRRKVKIVVTVYRQNGQRHRRSFLPGPISWTLPWQVAEHEEFRITYQIRSRA